MKYNLKWCQSLKEYGKLTHISVIRYLNNVNKLISPGDEWLRPVNEKKQDSVFLMHLVGS